MEPGEEEEVEAAVVVEEEDVAVAVIIGSTLTPACPTCSRALSRSTWTLCMSGRLTWQRLAMERDTGTDPIPTPTPIHTHTRTHTGSHQPT